MLPKCAHNSSCNMGLPWSQKLSKTEIWHFGIPLRVNKDITGLDIPVHHLWLQCLMQICQAATHIGTHSWCSNHWRVASMYIYVCVNAVLAIENSICWLRCCSICFIPYSMSLQYGSFIWFSLFRTNKMLIPKSHYPRKEIVCFSL